MPALKECKKIEWWPEGVTLTSCCTCRFCYNKNPKTECRNEFSPKHNQRVRFYNRCGFWKEAEVLQN